jgi:hypothetical protein
MVGKILRLLSVLTRYFVLSLEVNEYYEVRFNQHHYAFSVWLLPHKIYQFITSEQKKYQIFGSSRIMSNVISQVP